MRHILFSGFLSLIIFSCQKDKTSERRTENPQSDSTTLAMYVDLDTTKISGSDTLVVQKYSYDNLKRLSKSYYIEYDDGVPGALSLTDLFYNGNDTLPFKITETNYELPSGYTDDQDIGYYFYKDGKLISDSIRRSNAPTFFVNTYTYENNAIISTNIYPSVPYIITVNKHYQTRTNGNTTSQLDSSFVDGVFSGDSKVSFSASYDTKNNPFQNLMSDMSSSSIPSGIYTQETYSESMLYEKNNPVEIISGFHLKYFYEYNQNDYPSVTRVYDIEGPTEFLYKRIFIYTKL